MEKQPRPIPKKIEMIDPVMAEILRNKTEAERLAISHGMWRHARDALTNMLRSEHPEWTEEQIEREVARRMSNGAV